MCNKFSRKNDWSESIEIFQYYIGPNVCGFDRNDGRLTISETIRLKIVRKQRSIVSVWKRQALRFKTEIKKNL